MGNLVFIFERYIKLVLLVFLLFLFACESTQQEVSIQHTSPAFPSYTSRYAGQVKGQNYMVQLHVSEPSDTLVKHVNPSEAYSIALSMLDSLVNNSELFVDSSLSVQEVSLVEGNFRVYSIWFRIPNEVGEAVDEILFWVGVDGVLFDTVVQIQ